MIRPSGTEPKCKVYVDIRGDLAADADGADVATTERQLEARAAELAADLVVAAGL
jgi:phosphomannomutase